MDGALLRTKNNNCIKHKKRPSAAFCVLVLFTVLAGYLKNLSLPMKFAYPKNGEFIKRSDGTNLHGLLFLPTKRSDGTKKNKKVSHRDTWSVETMFIIRFYVP